MHIKRKSPFDTIGIMFDNLCASQMAYECIIQCNEILESGWKQNIALFATDRYKPCVHPNCSVFNSKDISIYKGPVICTSISTYNELSRGFVCKKFFYIYDITEFDRNKLVKDDDIQVVSRSANYLDRINNLGLKCELVVENFNIRELIKICQNPKS